MSQRLLEIALRGEMLAGVVKEERRGKIRVIVVAASSATSRQPVGKHSVPAYEQYSMKMPFIS
jgi:hypothetical protein